MYKVAIVLVNYNSYEDTLECVNSLNQISYPNKEIIVVDNNSVKSSLVSLKTIKNITLIESEHNGGFAYGNNIGIKHALNNEADYVLLLNNDTTVKEDVIEQLLEPFKDSTVGITTGKILYYTNRERIWAMGGIINWKLFVGYNGYTNELDNDSLCYQPTEFINGCCMMIKKEVFEKIGMLDESYFMYYEDLDYCIKVKEKYQLYINSKAIIYHKVSATSGLNSPFQLEWVTRSHLKFMYRFKKHAVNNFFITKINVISRKWIRVIGYIVRFDYSRAYAILKGLM